MSAPLNGCMCQGGECEACNRVVEAFEAMREALEEMHEAIIVDRLLKSPAVISASAMARAALALADAAKVRR